MIGIINRLIKIAREKDFLAKFICLLLSIVFWAFISSTKSEEIKFNIPIEIKNLPRYLTVSQMSNKYVYIVCDGKKEYLKNINVKNIKAFVNLENPKVGLLKRYPLHLVKQNIPESISVSSQIKDVSIIVERREEKWIKVIPRIVGNVKFGSVIGEIKIIPEKVLVSGPKTTIKDIEYIYTEDISIDNEVGEIERQVELKRDEYKNVTFSETNIKVIIPILEYKNLYSLDIPVVVKNIDKSYNYILESSSVKLFIRSSNNEKIVSDDIDAYIDISKINIKLLMKKNNSNILNMELPVKALTKNNRFNIVSIKPEKVIVKIIKKELK